jgi:hypothetical protein
VIVSRSGCARQCFALVREIPDGAFAGTNEPADAA